MTDRDAEAPGSAEPGDLLDAHRDCMRIVHEVEHCLDRQPDRGGRWLGELTDKLELLVATLEAHFGTEEQEYLYREVPVAFPQYADRLEKLRAEHDTILETAGSAIAAAGDLGSNEEIHRLRELNARVQLLVATIRRHEAEENEILLGAYWHDTGAGD